ALEPVEGGGLADIVEAHAVDHRLVLFQPEQARLRIALLWARGQRAYLDEAEAERQQLLGHFGVLVEACRQADGRRKIETSDCRLERFREIGRPPRWDQFQRLDSQPVRRLGVERKGQWADERVEAHVSFPVIASVAKQSSPNLD